MNKIFILQIGAILITTVIAGCDSKPTTLPAANSNSAANAASKAKAQTTIPTNAPPGAQPPEQSGNPSASVALEEFADFQCGSCAAAHSTMKEIKSMYGSRIHFVYRNFPLPMHDKGYDASLAATAAGMQNKFWDMQNMLFTNQKSWMSDPTYKQVWKGYAQKIGLDVAKWETDMNGMAAKNRVEADIARGKAANISSTPTLFINGVAVPFEDLKVPTLKTRIDAELQKSSGQNTTNTSAPEFQQVITGEIPAHKPPVRKLPLVAAIVAFVGLVDAVYLTIHHYTAEPVPCGLEFDCGVVLNSWWAEIGGVPLAAFGILGYLIALSLALFSAFKNGRSWNLFGVQATLMAAISSYLIYVQYAFINAWCQYCLLSAATSFTLFLLFVTSIFFSARVPRDDASI